MSAITPQDSLSDVLTRAERDRAFRYLSTTRDDLLAAVDGLSSRQWSFKPAPDSWSVAENVEHIKLVEKRLQLQIDRLGEAPFCEPGRDHTQMDEYIAKEIPFRVSKFQAPELVRPTVQWTPAELIEQFLASRSQTIHLLASSPWLRGRVLPHPVMGPWDGYQWLLAVAAHSARHTNQILEVKASPGFPQA